MRGLGRGTGAVVDTELQAGIRVHVGVGWEPTWSRHDGLDNGQCNAPRQGPKGPRGRSQGPLPAPPVCPAPPMQQTHPTSSRRLPSLCSSPAGCHHPLEQWRGLASAMASHRATARALGLDWTARDIRTAGWDRAGRRCARAGRGLDEGSCGQASALSTRPAAHHVVPLDTALGTCLTCPTLMFPFSFSSPGRSSAR